VPSARVLPPSSCPGDICVSTVSPLPQLPNRLTRLTARLSQVITALLFTAGKLADLVILEQNLFEVAPRDIHAVRVMRTILEGSTVFERGS
jgi:hypothetical protein